MKVGQFTVFIFLRLSNWSFIKYFSTLPACISATDLIDLKGDISKSEHGLFLLARCVAGPLPMLRPKRMMFSSLIPSTLLR